MRIAYFGTPELAVEPLLALVRNGHDVCCVVTAREKRRGRGGALSPTPVALAAQSLGIEVVHDYEPLVDKGIELGVVVAFGQIIPSSVLSQIPMVNIHFSLLPRWRGAAPLERAILAGDAETGVCIMEVAEGLDEGGIFATKRIALDEEVTVEQLRRDLSDLGASLLVDLLRKPLESAAPQSGEVTYAKKIDPSERQLTGEESALKLHRRVRIGGAFTFIGGVRVGVVSAKVVGATGPAGTFSDGVLNTIDGGLQPLLVRPAGKKEMEAAQWERGARLGAHVLFGVPPSPSSEHLD